MKKRTILILIIFALLLPGCGLADNVANKIIDVIDVTSTLHENEEADTTDDPAEETETPATEAITEPQTERQTEKQTEPATEAPTEPEPPPARYVWTVEPIYAKVMNLWWAGRIIFDGFELNLETGEVSAWDGLDYPTGGIPAPMEWLYDESNNFYGYYGTVEEYEPPDFKMYTQSAFANMLKEMYWWDPDILNELRAFRKIDASKVKQVESEWYDFEYDLSGAYIGKKFAVAYGTDFVTDFIFDHETQARTNSPTENFIAIKSGGKWGVVNKTGEVVVPFEFDEIIFSDLKTAFVLSGGKYGIIEIK